MIVVIFLNNLGQKIKKKERKNKIIKIEKLGEIIDILPKKKKHEKVL